MNDKIHVLTLVYSGNYQWTRLFASKELLDNYLKDDIGVVWDIYEQWSKSWWGDVNQEKQKELEKKHPALKELNMDKDEYHYIIKSIIKN